MFEAGEDCTEHNAHGKTAPIRLYAKAVELAVLARNVLRLTHTSSSRFFLSLLMSRAYSQNDVDEALERNHEIRAVHTKGSSTHHRKS